MIDDVVRSSMEFKFIELLSLDFLLTPSDIVKQHIIYRSVEHI